jgi:peroxiredoxin
LQVYQQRVAEMQALGATLVAISPQTPDNSLSMAEKNALQFEVLSDQGHKVARDYKVVFSLPDVIRTIYAQIGADLPKYNGDESWELPMPGVFVIAPNGTIRLAFVDADYSHRLEPQAIIDSLKEVVKA